MDTSTRGPVRAEADLAAAALLGSPPPEGTVPPLWHWFHLHEVWRAGELGPDGHPLHGVPAPPAPGLRRMFAGGRTRHLRPLVAGTPAERRSSVVSTVDKQGRSGPLTFVTVRHEYVQDGDVAVDEEHDIVYRAPAPAPPAGAVDEEPAGAPVLSFAVDPVVLFRFSAATGNAHRIHYDLPYAAEEGYPERVVHGPLQVVLMAEWLRARGVDLVGARFGYRLLRPVFGPQTLRVSGVTGGGRVPDAAGAGGRVPDAAGIGVRVHDAAGVRVAEATVSDVDGRAR